MAGDDLHRRKRNLMLISTVIILYVVTGTSVEDIRSARFYFLDFQIHRPQVLIYFGCLLLFWYWYQFWLASRTQQRFKAARDNIQRTQPFLCRLAEQEIKKDEKLSSGVRVNQVILDRPDKKYRLQASKVDLEEKPGQWGNTGARNFEITSKRWYWLRFRNWLSVAFARSTTFWDEVFPHIFGFAAALTAITDWLRSNPQ